MRLFLKPERGAMTMFISKKFQPYAANLLPVVTALLLSFGSYHSAVASQNVIIDMSKPISASQLAAYNRDGIAIDYDNTTVLKQVYVTDKAGAAARQLPSGAARKVKSYDFGEKLEVIEEQKDWYGVQDRIYREYDEDNDSVIETDVTKWEKVFVKKDQTGSINSIALTPDDLNLVSYLSVDENYEHFEKDRALDKYLKIELIDKNMFDNKRNLAVDFLSKDKIIKKKNGVLSIPTTQKLVKFTDNDVDNDGYQIFAYVGQIDSLNQHLISGSYYESGDYAMIDKETGKITQTFTEYPYISPNKKYIASAYANPYELNTDLELYQIDGTNITPIMQAGFKNWMPSTEKEDIFWARDGYLYLAVNHVATYWTADGNLNDQFQYIRIKVDL